MTLAIQQIESYTITIDGTITAASQLLATVAGAGVDFHAFKAIPVNPNATQFTLFAKDSVQLVNGARKAGIALAGPHAALLIKGDEEAGALAGIYAKLALAGIQVEEACGIADIHGGYGVVLYLTAEGCSRALAVLR
ncbi:MAG TPA: hypothetical protein PKM88_11165 [bacterium]|nr:hypothetical protein [bacterium]